MSSQVGYVNADSGYEKLPEQETAALELAQERVQSAEHLLQLRRTELQLIVDRVVKRAEENGKYAVTALAVDKGIIRKPVAEVVKP